MAHFAQSLQQPTLAFQEIINIHFDASLFYEDHGINSLRTYVDKMVINAKCEGCDVIVMQCFVWQIIDKRLFMCDEKEIM
jgi:hypothetical protein